VVAASGDETLRTTVFDIARGYTWPQGYTGRAVRNRFADAWHGREDAQARDEAARACYAEVAAQGDADIAGVFAGEGIDLIHAVEPAAAILARVIREAEAALARPLLPSA
jgi:nitronate monooxygenase